MGDVLTFAAITLPSWLTFNVTTQLLSGTPTNDDVGDHPVILEVTDASDESTQQSFTIAVPNTNPGLISYLSRTQNTHKTLI